LFSLSAGLWNPPTDIFECQEAAVIRMEVPGVLPADLEIMARGRRLIVRGHRSEPRAAEILCYHLTEVRYGRFVRVFEFPFALDQREIEATFEAGFLVIRVPKQRPAPSSITITLLSEEDSGL